MSEHAENRVGRFTLPIPGELCEGIDDDDLGEIVKAASRTAAHLQRDAIQRGEGDRLALPAFAYVVFLLILQAERSGVVLEGEGETHILHDDTWTSPGRG